MLSNHTEAGPSTPGGIYERPVDYLPERDVYESLCRGEGVKLVRPEGGSGPRLWTWSGQADLGRIFLCLEVACSALGSICRG